MFSSSFYCNTSVLTNSHQCLLYKILPIIILIAANFTRNVSLQKDPQLRSLSDCFWSWKLREFPALGTQSGSHLHDDSLESYALESYEARYRNCTSFLQQAKSIKRSRLTPEDDVTLSVLLDQLEVYTQGYKWKNYGNLNPISSIEGIHLYNGWVKSGNYKTLDDFEKYISRLRALPRQINEIIRLMERAISLNVTYHRVSVQDVPEQLSTVIDEEITHISYYEPIILHLNKSALTASQRATVESRSRDAITNGIKPAYQRLKTFMQQRYLSHTRESYGVSSFPNGQQYYRDILRWHLSTDIDPDTVHKKGIAEVNRIHNNMIKLKNQLKFDGQLSEFVKHIENKSEFFNHTGDELLDKYRHIIYERIEPRLPELFFNTSSVPRPLVKPLNRDGPIAMYMDSALYINTNRAETRPSYTIMAVALHESNPGHHYQVTLATELPFPFFRRYIWSRKYSAPFYFPYYTAYVEGWGLYAEFLGEELNLFSDPYELFGRYTIEMFRACRLVVDTGLHHLNWSRDRAITYMQNYTFMKIEEVEKEIDRYITWPGQACAYKIGEIKIREIRENAQQQLGSLFDVREFHWQVIKVGYVPLRLLEDSIDAWIKEKLVVSLANSVLPRAGLIAACSLLITHCFYH